MNNHLRLRYAWGALAAGVLIMSALPGRIWIGPVTLPYCPSRWVHFLVYVAVTSIPCAAWRTKSGVLCCLSVIAFSVVRVFFFAVAGSTANGLENVFSDLFGIAAGILLGLNLRVMGSSAGTVAGMKQNRRRTMTR